MNAESAPDVRYVVFHKPGRAWQKGVDFREQPGVMDHVRHYRTMFMEGRLEMGGPYLAIDSGGMMVPISGLDEGEVRRFAAADPAVLSGLLEFEIRPWYVAMARAR